MLRAHIAGLGSDLSHILTPSQQADWGRYQGVQNHQGKAPGSYMITQKVISDSYQPAKPENSTCFTFSPTCGVISLINVSPHALIIVALICLLLITYKLYHSFLTCFLRLFILILFLILIGKFTFSLLCDSNVYNLDISFVKYGIILLDYILLAIFSSSLWLALLFP